jgi:hypothetical protein
LALDLWGKENAISEAAKEKVVVAPPWIDHIPQVDAWERIFVAEVLARAPLQELIYSERQRVGLFQFRVI